ncbi:peptidoglycan/LPS O-acetylase OafA/YrhL [Pedobacter sp. W3I1]|uniref:acyltransferase family protein n=1 Tax=Pedobacter sp. W3I1 TaxID=3042291 RepID=UPI002786344B|nr:acyltransferase [Pedobacter sp. W3I1]MDQ0640908.1 peptidoglycan/LPS O-acetylase OafA/YrhL [Pedobacter sp. W3I1]
MANNRLKYLDAIRGVAVLMVLMAHSTELSNIANLKPMIKHFIESGVFGVQLFFIISAYTLFYTLQHNRKSNTNFYLRRLFRIAPAYYAAVLFYSFYNQYWGFGTMTNFLFLHGFSPKYINSIVPGGWSIGIEMFFYLFVPFLFNYITNLPKAIYFLFITFIVKILAYYIINLPLFSSVAVDGSFMYFWFPNQLPVFAIGFVLYFYLQEIHSNDEQLISASLTIAALVIFSIMTALPIFENNTIIAAGFAIFLAFLGRSKSYPWLENRLLLFIGKISYSAYLWQYAMIFLIRKIGIYNLFSINISGSAYINFVINYLILFTFTTFTAYISFLIIEKPGQKIGVKIVDRYFSLRPNTVNI